MDCLDKVEKKVVDKKVRKPKTQKLVNEEITSKMVSDQFDKILVEFKKLESFIFKPVEEPIMDSDHSSNDLIPLVKKPRAKKQPSLKVEPVFV